MVGMSIARRTRSGTLVGPGICRKCLPVWRVTGSSRFSLNSKNSNLPDRPINLVFQKLLARNPKGARLMLLACRVAVGHGACPGRTQVVGDACAADIGSQAADMTNLGGASALHLIKAEPASLHADVVTQLRDFIVE